MRKVKGLGYVLVFLRQPTGIARWPPCSALVLLWQLFFAGATAEDAATDGDDGHTGRRGSPVLVA